MSRGRRIAWVAVFLLGGIGACNSKPGGPPEPRVLPMASTDAPASTQAITVSDAGTPAGRASVLVTKTSLMHALEERGFDLGTLLAEEPSPFGVGKRRSTRELDSNGRYREIVRAIREDVAAAKKADPSAGVGIAFGHRLMDTKYLASDTARFELIGVSQRLDRAYIDASHCGELRFIYRLAYDTTVKELHLGSRLPMTIAVSFWNPGGHCDEIAKRWRLDDRKMQPDTFASEVISLGADRIMRSVEINAQTVRWPSTTRPDMAGHAEYTLREFVPSPFGGQGMSDGGRTPIPLIPGPLENTVNVEALAKDAAIRGKFLKYLAGPAIPGEVERGTLLIPPQFLASHATSVTPLGLERLQNTSASRLVGKTPLGLKLGPQIQSEAALLRRIDEMSCQGCHATRSIAGFHLLGDDTAPEGSVNAVLVGRSPHLLGDLPRREQIVNELAAGHSPVIEIPFAERSLSEKGARGAHCTLGTDPTYRDWTCGAGMRCVGTDRAVGIGECVLVDAKLGDQCEVGTVTRSIDPHKDRVTNFKTTACPGVCETNAVGFPSGMCASNCAGLGPDDTCGAIPFLTGFNGCLARKGVSFEDCIKQNSRPAGVQRCDEARPCRDDYICARAGDGHGACMPPYFLFQLRVDGHP